MTTATTVPLSEIAAELSVPRGGRSRRSRASRTRNRRPNGGMGWSSLQDRRVRQVEPRASDGVIEYATNSGVLSPCGHPRGRNLAR